MQSVKFRTENISNHWLIIISDLLSVFVKSGCAKQLRNRNSTLEKEVLSHSSVSASKQAAQSTLSSLNPMTLKKSDQQPTITAAELLCWQEWRGCMVRSDLEYQTIPGINESPAAPTQVSSWHSGQWSEQMLVTRMLWDREDNWCCECSRLFVHH